MSKAAPFRAAQLLFLRLGLLHERAAGVVVLGLDVQLLHQGERLLVHRLVVADHVVGEGPDLLVLGLLEGEFSSLNVDLPGRVGDVGDLRVGEFGGSLSHRAVGGEAETGAQQGHDEAWTWFSPLYGCGISRR